MNDSHNNKLNILHKNISHVFIWLKKNSNARNKKVELFYEFIELVRNDTLLWTYVSQMGAVKFFLHYLHIMQIILYYIILSWRWMTKKIHANQGKVCDNIWNEGFKILITFLLGLHVEINQTLYDSSQTMQLLQTRFLQIFNGRPKKKKKCLWLKLKKIWVNTTIEHDHWVVYSRVMGYLMYIVFCRQPKLVYAIDVFMVWHIP
jgi:hypothetical protein